MAAIVAVTPKRGADAQSLPRTPLIVVNEGDAPTAVHANEEEPEIADATSWEPGRGLRPRDLGDPEEVLEALSAAATTANRGNAPQEQGARRRGNRRLRSKEGGVEAAATGARPRPLPGPPGHGLLALHLH